MNEKYFSYKYNFIDNNILTLYHIILERKQYVLIQQVFTQVIGPNSNLPWNAALTSLFTHLYDDTTDPIKVDRDKFEEWYNKCDKHWSVEEFKVEHL